ncbi:MAG TPA: L,D-transpeptidase [Thermoanaerobaculia bacterium]|nr:L,D-transpeptidase [Thermoanaerobaculia bacterium]
MLAWILAATILSGDIEGLPAEAPKNGTVITVDLSTNQAYLFRDGELIRKSRAATGSEKVLKHGRRVWWFRTPRGRYSVLAKIKDPIWTKPDWAFVEEGKKVPPADSPLRQEKGKLGKYALDLGERVMIHGTNEPASIGKKVTHGCIRLPHDMLSTLWKEAGVGSVVYIYESQISEAAMGSTGLNDLTMTPEAASSSRTQ